MLGSSGRSGLHARRVRSPLPSSHYDDVDMDSSHSDSSGRSSWLRIFAVLAVLLALGFACWLVYLLASSPSSDSFESDLDENDQGAYDEDGPNFDFRPKNPWFSRKSPPARTGRVNRKKF